MQEANLSIDSLRTSTFGCSLKTNYDNNISLLYCSIVASFRIDQLLSTKAKQMQLFPL
jgi:hypothetical protein